MAEPGDSAVVLSEEQAKQLQKGIEAISSVFASSAGGRSTQPAVLSASASSSSTGNSNSEQG